MKSESIGRLPFLTPAHGDIYYLRCLLCHEHSKGKKPFVGLRTCRGQVMKTYKDVCYELGLLQDDREWRKCLEEADIECTPRRLREVFATIVVFNRPADVYTLLFDFSDKLGGDYLRDAQDYDIAIEPEVFVNSVVILIEKELEMMDLTRSQIDLIFGEHCLNEIQREQVTMFFQALQEAKEQTNHIQNNTNPYQNRVPLETLQELSNRISTLTDEQKEFVDYAEERISNSLQVLAFVNADAGTGKTYTLNTFVARMLLVGKQVLCCAFTGIASILLLNGCTFHSHFKASLDVEAKRGLDIKKKTKLALYLVKTDIIVIDEATQLHKNFLEDLNDTLRDLKGNDVSFGGVSIVLAGDFKQTLPIVTKSHQLAQVRVCIKNSLLWKLFRGAGHQFSFTINMRLKQVTDREEHQRLQEFQTFLLNLGRGDLPANNDGNIDIPQEYIVSGFETEEAMQSAAIQHVYGNINEHLNDSAYMMSNIIICPHNRNVKKLNDKIIESMSTMEYLSYSSDTSTDQSVEIGEEVLNTLEIPGLPSHVLRLKEKMPVMLMRNISKHKKLCNGTRLIVQKVTGNLLFTINPVTNEEIILPRFDLESDIKKVGIVFKRRQSPVVPAFAITANKSQGQTIKGKVAIYLWEDCFSHGQLYVASSRATHPSHLKYYIRNQIVGTRNVVLKQVL